MMHYVGIFHYIINIDIIFMMKSTVIINVFHHAIATEIVLCIYHHTITFIVIEMSVEM